MRTDPLPESNELFAADNAALAAPVADPAPVAQAPSLNIPAEVAGLIGDGKKYASVEAALAALPHAQAHISTLESENAEYKTQLMSNDKLDQVLSKLNSPSTPEPVAATPVTSGVSREELSALVQQEIQQTEKVNLQSANLSTVKSKLQETYGESATEKWNAKASEVGMSTAQLTALAKVAPQAVLALVGNNQSVRTPAPTSEGLNLSTIGNVGDTPVKKNIMFGASTKEIVNEWRASAPIEE